MTNTDDNSLVRLGQRQMVKSAGTVVGKEVGAALIKTSAGGLLIGGTAWLLPFITMPFLLVIVLFLGLFFYAKN